MKENNETVDFAVFNDEDKEVLNKLLIEYREVYKEVVDLEVKFALLKSSQEELLERGKKIMELEKELCEKVAQREGVEVVDVSNASGAYALKLLQDLQENSQELNNIN
jgi:hypothetical protein